MKILTLENYEPNSWNIVNNFMQVMIEIEIVPTDPVHSVVNRYKQYLLWTFLVEDDEMIAMSCVQTHFFPQGCARLLTRTYYCSQEYRRRHFVYEREADTPSYKDDRYTVGLGKRKQNR